MLCLKFVSERKCASIRFNPAKVEGEVHEPPPPLLIYLSSHENHFYTSRDAPGLLIKFIWAHINHAAKTF